MNLKTHLIYFSPTRTTQKIVEQIAVGIGSEPIEHHDLTLAAGETEIIISDGIAIIGIPVYAGRVPQIVLERMEKMAADDAPAILVALYGNREYEDALIELRDFASARGFTVIAAGAFIGEHSYSTSEQPIAVNRPDHADVIKAEEFGRAIAEKLERGNDSEMPDIPGDVPYKERVPLGGICPATDPQRCTLCGSCARVCPTFVISMGEEIVTLAEDCVMCCACVKNCPEKARTLVHPAVQARRDMLFQNCSVRKEPMVFI